VEDDRIVHESPLTYLPIRYYTRGYYEAATFVATDHLSPVLGGRFLHPDRSIMPEDGYPPHSRIWWIRINAVEETPFTEAPFSPGEAWNPKEVASFGNLTITLYER
jgi:hypothetical protein